MKHLLFLFPLLFFYALTKAQNKVGIGTIFPDSSLHIKGGFKLENGTQGAGKVLTSDNYGGAQWLKPSATTGNAVANRQLIIIGTSLTKPNAPGRVDGGAGGVLYDSLVYGYITAQRLGFRYINMGRSGRSLQQRNANDFSVYEVISTIPYYTSGSLLAFDAMVNDATKDTLDFTLDKYIQQYNEVLDTAFAHGWPSGSILLLNPSYWNPTNTVNHGNIFYRHAIYSRAMDSIASARKTLVFDGWEPFLTAYRKRPTLLHADSLHPTAAGQATMADNLVKYLSNYFETVDLAANQSTIFGSHDIRGNLNIDGNADIFSLQVRNDASVENTLTVNGKLMAVRGNTNNLYIGGDNNYPTITPRYPKTGRMVGFAYGSTAILNPLQILNYSATEASSVLNIGGGITGTNYPMTHVNIYAAANNFTTTGGVKVLEMTSTLASFGVPIRTTYAAGIIKASTGGTLSSDAVNLSSEVSNVLPVANGGTNASTANVALNNLLPAQTNNAGKLLQTNGTDAVWTTPALANFKRSILNTTQINNNAVANTLQDINGLSFDVVAGNTYKFKFYISYRAEETSTGARFCINGPAYAQLAYQSISSNGGQVAFFNSQSEYNLPATPSQNSSASAMLATIEGVITPSASGTVVARFASGEAGKAIAVIAGQSFVEFEQL